MIRLMSVTDTGVELRSVGLVGEGETGEVEAAYSAEQCGCDEQLSRQRARLSDEIEADQLVHRRPDPCFLNRGRNRKHPEEHHEQRDHHRNEERLDELADQHQHQEVESLQPPQRP